MIITAEYKVKVQVSGKQHYYTYYRCSRESKTIKCKKKPIREELLDTRLSDFLLEFAPPSEILDYLSSEDASQNNWVEPIFAFAPSFARR